MRCRSGLAKAEKTSVISDQIAKGFLAAAGVSVDRAIFVEQMMWQCCNLGGCRGRCKETYVSSARSFPGIDFSIGIAFDQVIEWSKHCARKWSDHDQQISWRRQVNADPRTHAAVDIPTALNALRC